MTHSDPIKFIRIIAFDECDFNLSALNSDGADQLTRALKHVEKPQGSLFNVRCCHLFRHGEAYFPLGLRTLSVNGLRPMQTIGS